MTSTNRKVCAKSLGYHSTLLTSTTMSGRSNRRDPEEEERIRREKELIRERNDPSYRRKRDEERMREKQRERELEIVNRMVSERC